MNLKELLKFLKAIMKRGVITASEKKQVNDAYAKMADDDKETAEDAVEEANDLETKDEDDDEEDEEVKKGIASLVNAGIKQSVKAMKAEVKEWMQEQKTLVEQKTGVYNPAVAEKRKEYNDKLREIFSAVKAGDSNKMKQLYEKEMTTDATGTPFAGYVVDSELSAEIRHLITEYGVARREMMTVTLSKNTIDANSLVTDITTFWVDEASAIQSSQVVLGQTQLALKKLATIVTMTSELLEDEEIDLASFITGRVAESFAQKEDLAFFNGDGTSTFGSFTGLLQNTSVNEVTMAGTTFASMDADDLIDMQDTTPQGALANGKYYMHRSNMSTVRKLKDDDGLYIYQRPSESGPATIWGKPVVLVEAMPAKSATAADTSFVLFGDLKKSSILGIKAGGIKIDKFNAGVVRNVVNDGDINLITTDREAIRFKERVGAITILPTAVTKLTTASASA